MFICEGAASISRVSSVVTPYAVFPQSEVDSPSATIKNHSQDFVSADRLRDISRTYLNGPPQIRNLVLQCTSSVSFPNRSDPRWPPSGFFSSGGPEGIPASPSCHMSPSCSDLQQSYPHREQKRVEVGRSFYGGWSASPASNPQIWRAAYRAGCSLSHPDTRVTPGCSRWAFSEGGTGPHIGLGGHQLGS